MKNTRFILALLLVICWPVVPAFASWSSTSNVTITRTADVAATNANEPITITVSITNSHTTVDLRGFYYTEQIPDGLTVNTASVKIDGISISNYTFETGFVDDVFPGYVPHRWVIETPPNWTESNPISYGNSVLEIIYTVTSPQNGRYDLSNFSWVGYYENESIGSKAVFGHGDETDEMRIAVGGKMMPWLMLLLDE